MALEMDAISQWNEIINLLFKSQININVPANYKSQISKIRQILKNDESALVSTILEFMIGSATVPFKFESQNPNLNQMLERWQKYLNAGLSIDIPKGLRNLTEQELRERWTTSLIALKVQWGEFEGFQMPVRMWLVDGGNIDIQGETNGLGQYKYLINNGNTELKNTVRETVYIRKPYNSWYEKWPTPYLAHKGALFNALLKQEILRKQTVVIESIIPYLLQIKAGNDTLAKLDKLATQEELDELVDKLKDIKNKFDERVKSRGTIGGFSYDVDIQHLIPDLSKFINDTIIRPIDRNLLASLGMIELEGFAGNRQETIMNPKMLVEEVKDAVIDLALLYEDVMLDMIARNRRTHPKFFGNNEIRVIPGKIKAFITDNMRILARSSYDRGLIDKKTFMEDYLDLDFEITVQRRDMEHRRNLLERLYPYVIMNQEKDPADLTPDVETPEDNENNSPESKTNNQDVQAGRVRFDCPNEYCNAVLELDEGFDESKLINCPECQENFLYADVKGTHHTPEEKKKNQRKRKTYSVKCQGCEHEFDYSKIKEKRMGSVECPNCNIEINQEGKIIKSALQEYEQAPFNTIDELPKNVRSVLPVGAQMIWLRVFNSIEKETGNEERAIRGAWSQVGKSYKKVPGKKKWVKR